MMTLLVALVGILPVLCTAMSPMDYCNRPECDPSHEPIENIFTAMTGYDILKGNPFSDSRSTDPGFNDKGYIFIPTVKNAEKRYALDDGITVRRVKNCDLQMTTEVISNARDYQKQLTKSMSSGSELATNLEYDVSVGANVKGVDIGVSTTVPPFASSAFSANNQFKKNERFFTEKTGIVSMAGAVCSSYTMAISQTQPPKFHPAFIKMLFEMQGATDQGSQKRKFDKFINQYGTHYLQFVQMGSRIGITKRYTRDQAIKTTLKDMKDCTSSSLSLFFGLIKSQSQQCTKESESETTSLYREYSRQYITTYGSTPDESIVKWSKQDFKDPLPIKMKLAPIANLFREVFMQNAKDKDGKVVKYKDILKWFLPQYLKYCENNKNKLGIKTCDVSTLKAKGCGWNDDCEVDQTCKNDKGKPEGYICENPERNYKVILKTTDKSYAGTNANVKIMLQDDSGVSSESFDLDDPDRDDFEAGNEDNFKFKTAKRLGNLRNVRISHDNSGSYSGWHLSWVKVKDVLRDRVYKFNCDRWLATDEGDRRLSIDCYEDKSRNGWGFKKAKKARKEQEKSSSSITEE